MSGLHRNIPVGAESAHPLGYNQTSDPGAVGAYKPWIDTTTSGSWALKIRNAANGAWETIGGAASVAWSSITGKPTTLSGYGITDAIGLSAYATLTDGATVTWATGGAALPNAKVTLGGNRTLSVTGAVSGQSGTLIVTQDGTGSRTLALPGLEQSGGLTLSTAAGAVDILAFTYDGTNFHWSLGKGFA